MTCNVCEGLIRRSCKWSHKEILREQDKNIGEIQNFQKGQFYVYTFGHATLQDTVAYEDIQNENLFRVNRVLLHKNENSRKS